MSLSVQNMVLFATNDGAFYHYHVDLAKTDASIVTWKQHIRHNMIPKYRRELHEPFEGMSMDDIDATANELREYYRQHVKEL